MHSVSHTYPPVKQNLRIPFISGMPILLGMSLGDQIKRARAELGISQTAIAKQFGISRAAVAQWENGTTRPDHDKLVELAAMLKLSLSAMLEGGEEQPRLERHDELIAAWELLTQDQRQDFLDKIKQQADTNQAILEQLAPPNVEHRTVSVSKERLKKATNTSFIRRRKNNVA